MSTPEFGVGDANANCPPGCVMFQNFTQQTACSKKLTKPIILTAYSLVPYVNIHRITTLVENSFFSGEGTEKYTVAC